MNTKQLIATLAMLAATGAACAQSTEYQDPAAGFVSIRTRAEVRAEIGQAAAQGVLVLRDGQDAVTAAGIKSGAAVRVESVAPAKTSHLPADITDTYFGA